MVPEEVHLGYYPADRVNKDVHDLLGEVKVRKGSYAIILGDDHGDNECTLYAIQGKYRRGKVYELVARLVESG